MINVRKCLDKQEWDDYVLENNGHPLQLWGWGELKSAHGWKADRVFLIDESNRVVGSAQLLIRKLNWPFKSITYIPRGPILNENNREELLLELTKYVKNKYRSVVLTIETDSEEFDLPKGWKRSPNKILPSNTIILDLKKSEQELLSDMETSTRRYIRKSAEENLTLKIIKDEKGLSDCLAIYKETAKRANFGLHKDKYYKDLFDKLGDHSVLYVAYSDTQPVAFLWLIISANTAFELYGGMTTEGRQLHASYALKWHAVLKSKDWGLERYDFGGLVEGGVTSFKKSWTDKETVLAGTFDYPLSVFYSLWNVFFPVSKKIFRKIMSLIGKK